MVQIDPTRAFTSGMISGGVWFGALSPWCLILAAVCLFDVSAIWRPLPKDPAP